MEEVVGLALGVIGLAGVIGAFKDVVDLCAIVIDTRGLGRDYEVLSTKFDIERTLLLHWARRVNLLHPTLYDHRLDDVHTQTSALEALSSTSSGGPFIEKFVKEFEAFNIRSGNRSRSTKWSSKVRWAVRDKQCFEDLVAMVAHFNTKLSQLLPETQHMPPLSSIGQAEAQSIGLNGMKIILDASDGHDAICQSARDCIERLKCDYRDRILDLLWFRRMGDRERSVAPEYNRTFEWALQPSQTEGQHPWDNLAGLLQHSPGIYWVSGKAGSGKSTLIKYLYHHPQTRALLAHWALGPCTLVRFYFWNLGTNEQKTQEGLSRSLLHQLLSANKALIESALPDMWKDLNVCHGKTASLPSSSETEHAFKTIAERLPHLGKMCFFIDGLDEFVGDYMEGIRFIKRLATSPNVKIVVSSRPIPDCVAAFEDAPKLHLYHLTRGDITSYVQGTLVSHEYMKILISQYPEEGVTILKKVIDKAAGVFLWVILACRSLLYGFAAYDRLEELRRRVHELPPELESMFQHMLQKVEPQHREQGARLLRLCYTNRRGQGDNVDIGDISTAGLAVLNEDPSAASPHRLGRAELRQRCDILIGRLRSWCGGLLELVPLLSADQQMLAMYEDQPMHFLIEGARWGAKSDREYPFDMHNIFWHLQMFFDQFRDLQGPHDVYAFSHLLDLHQHSHEPASSHASLIVALEAGAVNFVKAHPEYVRLAGPVPKSCECATALYYAIKRPHHGEINVKGQECGGTGRGANSKEKRKYAGDGLMRSSSDQKAKLRRTDSMEGATLELPILIDDD
ncbi:prion-inhibition and propagation-domain-containing protein [Podospora appendiculata]|uniref:Prion-inhibition and propagation-domain-containing protein n=1 Tax=Podospora appendiculata TaxID=314037 RepID=A0AAE1CE46_9PEZI|nr:prion-inhibition and propagation-domain-containing protein [Podospora appendiculata]